VLPGSVDVAEFEVDDFDVLGFGQGENFFGSHHGSGGIFFVRCQPGIKYCKRAKSVNEKALANPDAFANSNRSRINASYPRTSFFAKNPPAGAVRDGIREDADDGVGGRWCWAGFILATTFWGIGRDGAGGGGS